MRTKYYLFEPNSIISDTLTVKFPLSSYSEFQLYLVTDENDHPYHLRLFFDLDLINDYTKSMTLFGMMDNIVIKGEVIIDSKVHYYLVSKYITGESVSVRIKRGDLFSLESVRSGIGSLLNSVTKIDLNSLDKKTIELFSIENLWVNLDGSNSFSWINTISCKDSSDKSSDWFKGECNDKTKFKQQAMIQRFGAIIYMLLYGVSPWTINSKKSRGEQFESRGVRKPLLHSVSERNFFEILDKAFSSDGFSDLDSFAKAVRKGRIVREERTKSDSKPTGFDAIAGMEPLKEMIRRDVLDALDDEKSYDKYGLKIPNGILLYGPPGCGKTFFAEKMAEESGYNFFSIKPSDIQSRWINATQENIKSLFEEARESAPSIIFFDEVEALVPRRDKSDLHEMYSNAVNEFLVQMNDCSADKVLVVLASNLPDKIDTALLRTGRIDKKIFVPLPDGKSREILFEKILSGRPVSSNVSFKNLSKISDGLVASDIKFVCDEAARSAMRRKDDIGHDDIEKAIFEHTPTLSKEEIKKYKRLD